MARLFFSYSHKDETLRTELEIHLATLKRQGVIDTWHDRGITAGREFDREISKELEAADIILLLISPYFIASDYCYDIELKRALEKHTAGEAVVIPVILHPSDWQSLPFGRLTATPLDGKPISDFPNIHAAFLQVNQAIRKAAEEVNARSSSVAKPSQAPSPREKTNAAHAPGIQILHQLPPPLADFTDRHDELAKLQGKVQNDCRIYVFFGVGGIGKTDLANKFVHEHLLKHYPDAQFFVSLAGTSKHPKPVSAAQAHVISSVGKMLETNDVDPSAKYNDALHDKRAILFLDDASNNEQVLPLIPPPNCALVVTSRQKLILPGMYATGVPLLKLEDARDFLLSIAPRIGTHAETIAKLCGRLPIALRVVAAAILEQEHIEVEEFVKRLTDKKERRAIVQAPLDVSYDLLSPELQIRFARLSVFPESFDASGAAAIWDLPLDATKASLGDLLKISLLEWYEPTRRYSLQPLVRDFADSRLSESERFETEWKHAVYYLRILREAGSRYLQDNEASKEGLNLFDVERSNIHASQSWFANNLTDNSVADALTLDFSFAASRLLALKQTPPERIEWHNAAVAATKNLADKDEAHQMVQAGNLIFLAIAYRDLGNYDQTISHCKEALAIDTEPRDKRLESIALGYLGIAQYYKGNYDEATVSVQSAVEASQQTKSIDKGTQAELLRYLGHAYRGLGNYEKAIEAYNQSLECARQARSLSAENNALGALGRIHCDAGQQELARNEYLPRALKLAVEIGDRSAESYALAHLGLASRDLGLYAEAVDHYQKALKLATELGHKQVETYSNGGIGKTYLALNDFTNSLQHTQAAAKLATEIGMKRAQQFWETMLAQNHLHMGNMDQALEMVEKALTYKSPWVNYRSHAVHGLILAKRGNVDLSGESFRQAAEEAEKVLTKTPGYFDAQYLLGIAYSGMALANASDRASLVNQSCTAFEKAYAACNARGVIDEALRLLGELLNSDSSGDLNRPRDLVKQLAAATSTSTPPQADQ